MNKIGFLIIIILATLGCNTRHKYWDIATFNLQPGALKDNSEIKLLYTSPIPNSVYNSECYIHLIVISQEKGDTFNVLTTSDNGFKITDSSTIFSYFDENNLITKVNQAAGDLNADLSNIDSVKNIKLNDIRKIARDPKFDYLAKNRYPTVIGTIGLTTLPE